MILLLPTDDKSFARDTATGALVNTDGEALMMFKRRREEQQRQAMMGDRMETIEQTVNELRDMMLEIFKELRKHTT